MEWIKQKILAVSRSRFTSPRLLELVAAFLVQIIIGYTTSSEIIQHRLDTPVLAGIFSKINAILQGAACFGLALCAWQIGMRFVKTHRAYVLTISRIVRLWAGGLLIQLSTYAICRISVPGIDKRLWFPEYLFSLIMFGAVVGLGVGILLIVKSVPTK